MQKSSSLLPLYAIIAFVWCGTACAQPEIASFPWPKREAPKDSTQEELKKAQEQNAKFLDENSTLRIRNERLRKTLEDAQKALKKATEECEKAKKENEQVRAERDEQCAVLTNQVNQVKEEAQKQLDQQKELRATEMGGGIVFGIIASIIIASIRTK